MRASPLSRPVWKKLAGLTSIVALAVATATCGDDDDGPLGPTPPELEELLLTGGADTLLVNEATLLQVSARDEDGQAVPLDSLDIEWNSLDPGVLKVNPEGVVRALGPGTGRVEVAAQGIADTAVVEVFELSPEPAATEISGLVEIPASVDTAAAYVSTMLGGSSLIESDGSFSVSVSPELETTVLAFSGGDLFGLAVAPAVEAPAGASADGPGTSAAQEVTIDALATATALVYLNPLFAAAPPGVTDDLLELIRSLPEVQALGQLLADRLEDEGAVPDVSDAEFVTAYRAAVAAAHQEVASQAGFESVGAMLRAILLGEIHGSGLSITTPDQISPSFDVEIQNHWQRWVTLYELPSDRDGTPVDNGERRDWLTSADVVPDVLDLPSWYDILKGNYKPADSKTVQLSFTADRPRLLLYAYGPGLKGFAEDHASIGAAGNHLRWVEPTAMTALADMGVPILEAVIGFDLGGVVEKFPTIVEGIDLAIMADELSDCMADDPSSAGRKFACAASEVLERVILDEENLRSLLRALKPDIDDVRLHKALEVVGKVARIIDAGDTAGDLVPMIFAVARAELRHEFDLSYNDLLGATTITSVSGDGQRGGFGEPLSEPLVVQVSNDDGEPLPDAWVTWSPGDGSGSTNPPFSTTDGEGRAQTEWTLGPDQPNQSLEAAIAGTRRAVVFNATVGTNSPPVATLDAPHDGDVYTQGEVIVFDGFADDPEDGSLTGAALVWTSDLDGQIGTGETFERGDLQVGTHVIELTATDSDGASDSESITIIIEPPASDDEFIAFSSDATGTLAIYGMDTDGTNVRLLSQPGFQPRISPDGSQIAFWWVEENNNCYLVIIDSNGANRREMDPSEFCDRSPTWSPDGNSLAFVSEDGTDNYDLYTMDVDGSNLRRWTDTPFNEWGPSWASDGASLLFSSRETVDFEIYRLHLASGQVSRLTNEPGADDYYPVENSDGSSILFSKVPNGAQGIYRMNPDGSNVQQIYPDLGISQSWSVDETRVVTMRDHDTESSDIVSVRTDGLGFIVLTGREGIREDSPDWGICNGCLPAAPSIVAHARRATAVSALPPRRPRSAGRTGPP